MRDEFPFLSPSSRDDILARVLVPSSDLSALEDGADEPLIYSSPFDPSATSYQTIVHAEQALQDYWQHPRTPSVWEHLIYYRRSFEKDTSIGRKDPEYTDFGEYLDFCESGLPPAVDQSTSFPTSEELDMISTLGKQWSLLSRKTPFLPYQSNMTDQEAEAAREHTTSAHLAPRVRSCAHEFSNAKAAALNQAFLRACENGEVEWAKRLFQRGASIYSADGSGEKASFKAVRGGSLPLFRFLALQGADLQEVNTDGDTILHIAAQYGRIPILDWMWQQQGAPNFHTQNKDGDTPLHAASQRGQLEAVQWIDMALADSDHSKNVSNNDGDTPLHKAAEHGHLPVVQWLCEQGGVAAHKMNDMMATPLDLAVWSGHDVVADWLQNH
jgi:ankyrin repeat protein